MISLIQNWLKELGAPVSRGYLKQQLFSHPDYPSLISLTATGIAPEFLPAEVSAGVNDSGG
jgi:hypothetical protein